MYNSNVSIGDSTELKIAKYYQNKKFLVVIIPKNIDGQPVDIIACKNDEVWLIDAKHVTSKKSSFSFNNIRPNQISTMRYARNCIGIQNLGFVIEWDREPQSLFFFSYDKFIELAEKSFKSVKIEELERWKNECRN
ncbi:Holliday junction resolvase RecU [Mammaliicoccus vitulinus]|uniref:Holliday junction resolvase RecU n=1 Tax=Mammaliicoccus vitulinus TaxID=71237 RepID=UPI00248D1D3A|nr:Holliday junction resolvase RecU [Mammaliicoccus vitulinus]